MSYHCNTITLSHQAFHRSLCPSEVFHRNVLQVELAHKIVMRPMIIPGLEEILVLHEVEKKDSLPALCTLLC